MSRQADQPRYRCGEMLAIADRFKPIDPKKEDNPSSSGWRKVQLFLDRNTGTFLGFKTGKREASLAAHSFGGRTFELKHCRVKRALWSKLIADELERQDGTWYDPADTSERRTMTDNGVAAAAAGGVATAAYLNGKYQIGRDLKAILKDRKARKAYAQAGS